VQQDREKNEETEKIKMKSNYCIGIEKEEKSYNIKSSNGNLKDSYNNSGNKNNKLDNKKRNNKNRLKLNKEKRLDNKNTKNNYTNGKSEIKLIALILAIMLFTILKMPISLAVPGGPSITYNYTETNVPAPATAINTSGGTITTMNLYGITQDPRWKAYVGNVSGKYSLQDASNYTIYDWTITTVAGEVYASRTNAVNWSTIGCANSTQISSEETALNITSSYDDSLSRTFANKVHRRFYVGTTEITNSSCYAIATFVSNQSQPATENADFQEVLLSDKSYAVYAGLLENKTTGYNVQKYDFQMIVPDYGIEGAGSVLYYFYMELI